MFARIRESFRAAFARARVESEMEKEMRLHVEMETEQNMRRGMAPDDARRAALVAFGGIENAKEATRDERSTRLVEQLGADVRFALRGMRKRPGFTAAVIGLVALGTGANAAIYSALHRLVLHPLPFANSDRLVEMTAVTGGGRVLVTPTKDLIEVWRDRSRLVERIGVASTISPVLGDSGIQGARQIDGVAMGPGMMSLVGLRPRLGRDVMPSDTASNAPPIAILSDRLWKTAFGSRSDVVGSRIRLDGVSTTIVGIAPPEFAVPFNDASDIFTAIKRSQRWDAVGRLSPGVSLEQANRELAAIAGAMEQERGQDPPRVRGEDSLVGNGTKRILYLMLAAVGFVLLIACANIANLLLVRAWSRQREFAIRVAMGAGRARIVSQLLTESLLHAMAGGALGLLVAVVVLRLLTRLEFVPGLDRTSVSAPAVVLTLMVAIVTGLAFGMVPARVAGAGEIGEFLKASARSVSEGRLARRVRGTLVVVEVALSVVLVVGTGLLFRSLVAMAAADPGVQPRGLFEMKLQIRSPDFADSNVRRTALSNVLAAVRRAPGVDGGALALTGPVSFMTYTGGFEIEGSNTTATDSLKAVQLNVTTPDYFRVAGIRIVQGRPYGEDSRPTAMSELGEVMINERFARRFWPNGGAIGARIRNAGRPATIVGVVSDVDIPSPESRRAAALQVYLPMPGAPRFASLVVRSRLPQAALDSALRKAVALGNARVRAGALETTDAYLTSFRRRPAVIAKVIGGFAALAMLLAAIGLHAVIAYSVKQREREIGIRIALGARQHGVAALIFGDGMRLAGIGAGLGVAGAVVGTRVLRGILFGVEPNDPATFAATVAILVVAAAAACAVPAIRATRIDPVELVRVE
jgi:putative ABC transport system permease protein